MTQLKATCLLVVLACGLAAADDGGNDRDLGELSQRLEHSSIDERLSAVEGLYAWSLTAREPGTAITLLQRASSDPSTEVSRQAIHLLKLLSVRYSVAGVGPVPEQERAAANRRRAATQLRDLEAWRERLAHGDPTSRLQAVKALAAHARVASNRAEILELLELSTGDRSLLVAEQARVAVEELAVRSGRTLPR